MKVFIAISIIGAIYLLFLLKNDSIVNTIKKDSEICENFIKNKVNFNSKNTCLSVDTDCNRTFIKIKNNNTELEKVCLNN